MIVISGGDVVLPDRILTRASLIIDGDRIAALEPSARVDSPEATTVDAADCYVVPGFIDVHVHGVEGHDTLNEGTPIAAMAALLPQYGVSSFCPTTVACPPEALRGVLRQVATLRANRPPTSARVLPAHLESNFISPEFRGAQPSDCLRLPPDIAGHEGPRRTSSSERPSRAPSEDAARTFMAREGDFSGRDILDVIAAARSDVGIVTLAPELPGGIDLVRSLVSAGHRVALGHTGASLEEAVAAIDAGARHATHLFNRMAPITHRAPGVAGAVLAREDVAAELICDGYHVHSSMSRIAIASKGVRRIMAITDGTSGAGLEVGSHATLGGRRIRVTDQAAVLDDGTLAGSTLTMDRAFRTIVKTFGCSVSEASVLCSTTPAEELGLAGFGRLAEGGFADVVILNRRFGVVRTFIGGEEIFARS
jgi:N-acetylglucosamine-6-phosphate deacetylase